MSAGRPSDYTPELATAICAEIALGYSLRTICKAESMPCVATVFNWPRLLVRHRYRNCECSLSPTVRSEDKVAVIALSLGQERNDMLRGSPNNVTLSVTCAVQ
jgi:hypothetical protein